MGERRGHARGDWGYGKTPLFIILGSTLYVTMGLSIEDAASCSSNSNSGSSDGRKDKVNSESFNHYANFHARKNYFENTDREKI